LSVYETFGVDRSIELLRRASELFEQRRSFSQMEPAERKAIAGTFARGERRFEDREWGWFGSMAGQGDFKTLVNEPSGLLSSALSHIPSSGTVFQEQYYAFADDFNAAFEVKAHKGGIATASRLLVMKRPDQFVGVNDANRRGLAAAFGTAYTSLSIENYWQRIVIPTMETEWWQHPRPRNAHEGSMWDNRAALLDSIYFIPK
jgi:hypothetical protein